MALLAVLTGSENVPSTAPSHVHSMQIWNMRVPAPEVSCTMPAIASSWPSIAPRLPGRQLSHRPCALLAQKSTTRRHLEVSKYGAAHRRLLQKCYASSGSSSEPSLQLATAKLPNGVNPEAFTKSLYDWASSMTSSGKNMPFSLPIRTRQKDSGIEIALLRVSSNKRLVPVGSIFARVEDEAGVGKVLFVRFYEGEAAQDIRSRPLPEHKQERLRTIVDGLVDVPQIMGSMKNAIKQSITLAK